MTRAAIAKGLAQLHLPASWIEWVESIEVRYDTQREGPYEVHKPRPPEREYETIEEDWDGYEETVRYETHTMTDAEMVVATLNYEMALQLWTERHGNAETAQQYIQGPTVFVVTLKGNGRKLEMMAGKPENGWMIQSWSGF
jgi:hypothetical protein